MCENIVVDTLVVFHESVQNFQNCLAFSKYTLKKHPKVLAYFNNFDDHLSEESLWQISEAIRPRGGKKKHETK